MSETKKDSLAPMSDVSECSTFANLLASVLSTPVKKRHLEDNDDATEHSPKRQKIEHSPSISLPPVNNNVDDAVNKSTSSMVNGSEPDEELFSSAKKLLDASIGADNESARQEDSDDLFSKVNRADSLGTKKVEDDARNNNLQDLMETDEPMKADTREDKNDEPLFTSARSVQEPDDEPMFTSAKKLLRANGSANGSFRSAKSAARDNAHDEPMFASAKSRLHEESNDIGFVSARKMTPLNGPDKRRVKIGDKPLKGKKVNISDLFDDDDMDNVDENRGTSPTRALEEPLFQSVKNLPIDNDEPTFSSAKDLLREEEKKASSTAVKKAHDEEPLFTSAKQLMGKSNNVPPTKATPAQKRVVIKGPPLKKAKISAIFDEEEDTTAPVSAEFSFGGTKGNEPKTGAARSNEKSSRMSRIFDSDEEGEGEGKQETDEDLLAKYGGFTNFATGKSTTNILKDKKNIDKAQKVLGEDTEKKAKLSRIFDNDEDEEPNGGTEKASDEDLLEKYGGFTNFSTGKNTTNILKNKDNLAKAQKVLGDDGEKKAKLGRIFDDEDEPDEGDKKEADEDLLEKYGGFTNFATGKSTTNILKNKTSISAAQKVLGDNGEKKSRLSRIFDDDDEENSIPDETNKEPDEDLLEKYGGFTSFATGKNETNILKKKDSLNAAQKMLGNADEKKSQLSRIFDDDDDEEPKEGGEDALAKYGGFQNVATKQPMKPPAKRESVARVNAIFDEKDDDEKAIEKAFAKRREQAAPQRAQKRQPAAPLNPLEKGKKPFVKPRATVTPSKPPVIKAVPNVPLASSQDDQISQSDIDLLAGLDDFTQLTQDKEDSDKMVVDTVETNEGTTNFNNDNVNNEDDQIINNNNTNVNNVNTNREEHIDSQTARQIQETLEGIDFDKEFADLEPQQENVEVKEDNIEQATSNSPSPSKSFFYTVGASQAPKTPTATAKAPSVVYSTPTTGNKKFKTPPTPQSTPGTVHRRFVTPSSSMFKQKSNASTPSTVKRKGFESTNTNATNGLLSPNVNKQLMFSPNKATPRKAINYGVGETPKKSGGTSPSRPNKEIALFNLTKPANRYSLKDFSVKYLRRPEHLSEDTLRAYNIDPAIMSMTADSAAQFKFQNPENPGELIGYNELRTLLLGDGAVEKLATVAWVKNHYKWIVWKLASMERMFPQDYANQYLTAARVLSQLKYRYEREINQAQRPAIRKILERDEFAGRYMVLCVSAIRYRGKDGTFVPAKPIRDKGAGNPFPPMRKPSDPTQKEEVNENANEEEADYESLGGNCGVVEVTDGWYSVNAHLDEYMTALLRRGKIFVGLKLRVFGATITGSDQGASPLEITPSTMLKLRINGVRRAKWHAKLGLQRSRDFVVNLKSVRSLGGPIPSISVLIERVYPTLYMEAYPMRENSFKVTRTETGEWRAKKIHEDLSRTILDKKYNELVKEQENDRKGFLDHLTSNFGKRKYSRQDIYEVDDKEELYYLFRKEHESPEFLQLLSHQQHNELMRFIDELNATDREEVDKQLAKYREDHADLNRTVTPFVRVQVRDHPSLTHNPQKITRGYLTIWNPHPEIFSTVREGYHVTISMANPSESRDATAILTEGETTYMTANKMTRYNLVSRTPAPSFKARECIRFDSFGKLVGSKEFDMVGVVIGIDQKQEVYEFNKVVACQTIYLTDTTGVILVVQIRCNTDDFPNRDIVTVGNIVGMANLTYRFYDERCGVHMSSTSIYTAYYSKSNVSPFMQSTRDTIDQWMKQDAGKQVIAQLKEKIDEMRDMNSGRNNNDNNNGYMYYSQVNQNTNENAEQVNTNENEGELKSYLDDDLDEILAKIDV